MKRRSRYWLNPQPDDVPVQVSQGLVVAKGPLSTEGVNWDDVLADATAAHVGPEGDWEPVVSAGKFVLVAIREHPVRQVWIGFQAAGFSDRADFVVFWSEIFNWLGKAGPVYSAQTIPSPNGDWVPILSHSADGSVTAYNAPPMPEHLVDHLEWRDNLGKVAAAPASRGEAAGGVDCCSGRWRYAAWRRQRGRLPKCR